MPLDAVIPCEPDGKRPLVPWREYQTRLPTAEEREAWRRQWPNANHALVTGSVSGVVVLDVDPRRNGEHALQGRALPPTRVVRTPSGGTHYYFQHPGQTVPCVPDLLPGLDLKGDGGYVLIPPSSLNGRSYEVVIDEPPAPMPAWLRDLLQQRTSGNGRRTLPATEIEALLQGVEEGRRDVTATRLAGHFLARGLPEPEVRELLLAWNLRNRPPLPPAAIAKCVTSIARREAQKSAAHARPLRPTSCEDLPEDGYLGIAADFAALYATHTEAPRAFLYFAFLTYLGSLVAHRVTLHAEVQPSPRLYTVCLGPSADGRKSSALEHTDRFFRETIAHFGESIHYGLGSAEGLARHFEREPGQPPRPLLVHLDELRVLVDKARPEGSIILPMLATLFERTVFDNTTRTHTIHVRDAYLSLIAACTAETYTAIWTSAFLDIGFTNRLWLVVGAPEQRVALPASVPAHLRRAVAADLGALLARIDRAAGSGQLALRVDEDAAQAWQAWYEALPRTIHSRRLDTYGWRLMILLSLSRGNLETVSADTVRRVCALLEHQLALRQQFDPVDAENTIARLEELIRRALRIKGPLSKRDIRRFTNADRYGAWIFTTALDNVVRTGDARFDRTSQRYIATPEGTGNA